MGVLLNKKEHTHDDCFVLYHLGELFGAKSNQSTGAWTTTCRAAWLPDPISIVLLKAYDPLLKLHCTISTGLIWSSLSTPISIIQWMNSLKLIRPSPLLSTSA